MKKLLLLFFVGILAGCSSTEQYKLYANSHSQVEAEKYKAEAAKYKAMSDIANSGSESAKIAAVMAIALGGSNNGSGQRTTLQAPQISEALQWAQILVPSVVQTVGIVANKKIAITQSNNAAAVAQSTNAAFVGMAGQIQAPAANVTTTNTDDHTQTLSGTGTLGSGAYSTADNHSVSTDDHTVTSDSHAVTTDDHATTSPIVTPVVVVETPVFSATPVTAVP